MSPGGLHGLKRASTRIRLALFDGDRKLLHPARNKRRDEASMANNGDDLGVRNNLIIR